MPPVVWCRSGAWRGSSALETETAIGNFTSPCVDSRPSMPPRDEDGGAGHGPHASGPRPAPYIARLSRASAHARSERHYRLARSSSQSPPFLVFQRVVSLDKEGMLRKHRVSAKNQPGYGFSSKRALMLWPA